ncbi:MAG: tetratricopeptide repeat protein [Pleurocapsa minor GSE-CHR-MK-17-07R]|nr:tetratricopeptide repeat protein [Pleurocapsa minor GSE-CHR-MK 17-07R]
MGSDQARELRQQGITAAKAGRKDEARQLLQQSIRIEPNNEAAWLWLASVARDKQERIFCLQKILEINPMNKQAREGLEQISEGSRPPAPPTSAPGIRKLGSPPPSAQQTPPPAMPAQQPAAGFSAPATPAPQARQASPSEADIMNQAPGVPLPPAEKVSEAQKQAEAMLRQFQQPPPSDIVWVKKTKRRAGEGDVNVLRAQIGAGIGAAVVLLGILGIIFVNTNEDANYLVFGPTPTFTASPTVTPTVTPGFTPTPSPEPRRSPTPSPVPPSNLRAADPYNIDATAVYPPLVEGNILRDAVNNINRGNYDLALPTLSAERDLNPGAFNPFYYQALAYALSGEIDRALDVLGEADEQITGRTTLNDLALVNSGYAQVYWLQYQRELGNGRSDRANTALQRMAERLIDPENAGELDDEGNPITPVPRDTRLVEPYLLLSRYYMAQNDEEAAIEVLDEALAVDALSNNVQLLVEKGRVYALQGEYDLAAYQAYLALYVDPTTEAAYDLSILTNVLQGNISEAVAQAQNYLYYYPGSSHAYRLLGDARLAEGSVDLAIAAYSAAAQGGTDAERADALAARGALYVRSLRPDLARVDFTESLRLVDDPTVRFQRLRAAAADRRYELAEDDISELRGVTDPDVPADLLSVIEAQVLIQSSFADEQAPECAESTTAYSTALNLAIPVALSSSRDASLLAAANELVGIAQYCLGDLDGAIAAIGNALTREDSAARHYWRGRILEAREDFNGAARDYEWVASLGTLASLGAPGDAADRLAALGELTEPEATEEPAAGS